MSPSPLLSNPWRLALLLWLWGWIGFAPAGELDTVHPAPPAATSETPAPAADSESQWLVRGADGATRVRIQFYWSQTCPHCRAALPFLARLQAQEPWIEVQEFEISGSRSNLQHYVELASGMGERASSVPAFFVCGQMLTGYDSEEGMGRRVLGLARFCRQAASARSGPEEDAVGDRGPAPSAGSVGTESRSEAPAPQVSRPAIDLPLIGPLETASLSLPLFTLVIAGLDAFNPCAFFVLLFLLSLLVHARSRTRMLLVGGTFVLFSGLVYFLFMAAWLNLFVIAGGTPVVTAVAGVLALVIGTLNVKDSIWLKQGPSLSIPESAKPGLFRRMRVLASADRPGTMLVGTVALALAANSYEILCTAGFPMVFTRALSLNGLSPVAHYGYLALYNLIYILPLLAIVLVFTYTLGSRKLSEHQGRILKLLSGLMMLGLGALMLLSPARLSDPWSAALLLGVALTLTGFIALISRRRARTQAPPARA